MVAPISGRRKPPTHPVRFKNQVEDLQRTAREKVQSLGGAGKYTLPGGDDLQVEGKQDGTVELNLKREGESSAQLEYSAREKSAARVNTLKESEAERERDPAGPGRQEPQYLDLDRGELMDLKL